MDPVIVPTSRLKRAMYFVLGFVFLGIAYLGAILPGLPTTPWVLLASYCFSRSSPRMHRWLRRSPLFGKLIRDWEAHHGIRKSIKITAAIMVVIVVSLSITLTNLPVLGKIGIGILAGIGLCVMLFFVPTIREESKLTSKLNPDDNPCRNG